MTPIGDPTPTATGHTLMLVGRGSLTKTSAGPLITMAVGADWPTTDGFGFQGMSGARLGFHGALAATTSVGLLCHRRQMRLSIRAARLPGRSMSLRHWAALL